MVLPDSHRMFVSCATWDSTSLQLAFAYRSFTFFGWAFQPFLLAYFLAHCGPATPTKITSRGLASSGFARRYYQNHLLVFFS